jgi:phosphoribosylformimino-5-aminoimidazole carboxamide ribonucleotide (ProFAR) isomerase
VIAEVRVEAELIGRDPRAIEMTVGGARTVADAERMAELGVDRLVVAVRSTEPEQVHDELATFGETVIAPTRDL